VFAHGPTVVIEQRLTATHAVMGVEAVEKLRKIHFSSRIYAINPVK
jgi:hypothetical protein